MLEMVTAVRFDRRMTSGRTNPCLLSCINYRNEDVEVIAKFSGGCDRGEVSLITEAITAMLGIDLGLPIPAPFLVAVDQDFIDIINDEIIQQQINRSIHIGFGSKKLPNGYSNWIMSEDIPTNIRQEAANIIAFDGIVQNPDRRPENTNCLSNGKNLAIFDHDLAFIIEGIIGWRPPWNVGSLDNLINAQNHIFFNKIRGKPVNFEGFRESWSEITDERLQDYLRALPTEWLSDLNTPNSILSYISDVRDHIDKILVEVERLLS